MAGSIEQQLHSRLADAGGVAAGERREAVLFAGCPFRLAEGAEPIEMLGDSVKAVPTGATDVARPAREEAANLLHAVKGAGRGLSPVAQRGLALHVEEAEGKGVVFRLRHLRGIQLDHHAAKVFHGLLHGDRELEPDAVEHIPKGRGMLLREIEEAATRLGPVGAGEDVDENVPADATAPVEVVPDAEADAHRVAPLGGNQLLVGEAGGCDNARPAAEGGNAVPDGAGRLDRPLDDFQRFRRLNVGEVVPHYADAAARLAVDDAAPVAQRATVRIVNLLFEDVVVERRAGFVDVVDLLAVVDE